MNALNEQYLYPLWGNIVIDYKMDLVAHSMHFTLYAGAVKGPGTFTQIDIYNIRMFCYAEDSCSQGRIPKADADLFPGPCDRTDLTELDFSELVPGVPYNGLWISLEEIEAARPGQAKVDVFFDFHPDVPVPSPFYRSDQNIVIEFADSAMTLSAEKIAVNGKYFRWNQERGTFEPEEEKH